MPRSLPRWLWPSLIWEAIRDIGTLLWPARFSVGVLIVSIPFLFLLAPSQDALLALVAGVNRGSQIIFAAASLFWALETYYWADFMSRLPAQPKASRRRGQQALLSPKCLEALNKHLPRWLGLCALLVVGLATLKANRGNSVNTSHVWVGLAIDIVLYILLCWRRNALLAARSAWRQAPKLRRAATPRAAQPAAQPQVTPPAPHRTLFAAAETGTAPAVGTSGRLAAELPPRPPGSWRGWAAVAILAVATLAACIAGGTFATETRQLAAVGLTLAWLVIVCAFVVSLRDSDVDRKTKRWVIFNLIVFAVIMTASIQPAPVLIGWAPTVVTSPSVILSVFAAWVFLGSFFIALPGERLRLPVLTLFVLLAVVWGFLFADNHDLRLRPDRHLPSLTLDQALTRFTAGRQEPVPLVIIATAGGASRAGYWTAKILGEIEDAHPDFHKYVFAISSVSGGTLGAGVWRAMLEDGAASSCSAGSYAACARHFFCQDFLGPTLLTGLYADLTQRLLPGSLLPDRATALEQSWEAAWDKVMTKSPTNRMRAAFHDLTPQAGAWRPLLLINGTSEKSGRRIVTSQLAIDARAFPDTVDFFGAVASEINLSTALHNSARFPYIDTAGNIRLPNAGQSLLVDRIVDGGYFENFGAGTASDLLQSLRQSGWASRIAPIVIQIGSDPALLQPAKREAEWHNRLGWWFNIASDTTVPVAAFYDTRDALGYRATEDLKRSLALNWPSADGSERYAYFRLTDPRIPMSWAMSSFAIGAIDAEWTGTAANQSARHIVEQALWPGSAAPPPATSASPGCSDVR